MCKSLNAILGIFLAMAVLSALGKGQSFNYPNFSNPQFLFTNGAAATFTDLRLNDLSAMGATTTGTAWRSGKMSVTGGFITEFEIQIPPLTPGTSSRREGMTFTIHDDPTGPSAIGAGGSGLGYSGITNALSVEFDMFANVGITDTAHQISVHTRGAMANHHDEVHSLGAASFTPSLTSVHLVNITYHPGTLHVSVDGNLLVSVPYNFVTGGMTTNGSMVAGLGLPNDKAFVGFTAAGSGSTAVDGLFTVRSWNWNSADDCRNGTVGAQSGGPYDVLTINGSSHAPSRLFQIPLGASGTLEMNGSPEGPTNSGFMLFATLGAPPPFNPIDTLIGSICFPIGLGSQPTGTLLLVDSIGIGGPALLPGGLTPWSTSLHPFTFPVAYTMQGIIGDANSPYGFGITNAISVRHVAPAPPVIGLVSSMNPGPGGSYVVVGAHFDPALVLDIDGTNVPSTWVSINEFHFTAPANLACTANMTVTNPNGQSAAHTFGYGPTIANGPYSGLSSGGFNFVILGTGFDPATTVTIGGVNCSISVQTQSTLVVTPPPGAVGTTQPLVLTNGSGCSAMSSFSYL